MILSISVSILKIIGGYMLGVLLFLVYYIFILKLDYDTNKKNYSPFLILTFPYVAIIVVNNLIAVHWGFYKISVSTITFLGISFGLFLLGILFYRFKNRIFRRKNVTDFVQSIKLEYYQLKEKWVSKKTSPNKNSEKIHSRKQKKGENKEAVLKFEFYNMPAILKYAVICEGIITIRVLYIILKYGFAFFAADENEGYLMTGILGHLLLTLYVVIPILFYYWLRYKKNILFLISSLYGIGLFFLTFVKYHSICLIVLIYIFIVCEDKKYLKKGIIIIASTCILAFILSYSVTFISRGTAKDVDISFYIYHLWKYVGGSVINDNHIFTDGIRIDVSFFFKIGTILFALPNMFINKIFGTQFFVMESLPMLQVADMEERSNVVDFIGYMYPSKGEFLEIVCFGIFMIGFGFLSQHFYACNEKAKKGFYLPTSVYLTFFCFFSFFSTYGTLSTVWEILVMSYIIPHFFRKDSMKEMKRLIKDKTIKEKADV